MDQDVTTHRALPAVRGEVGEHGPDEDDRANDTEHGQCQTPQEEREAEVVPLPVAHEAAQREDTGHVGQGDVEGVVPVLLGVPDHSLTVESLLQRRQRRERKSIIILTRIARAPKVEVLRMRNLVNEKP